MAGNITGGKKAAAKNEEKYGKDFYQRIGRLGGQRGHKGGFAGNPELARRAGAKGGAMSKRGEESVVSATVEPIAEQITKEYGRGDSLRAIATRHNLSYGMLSKWARNNLDTRVWEEK